MISTEGLEASRHCTMSFVVGDDIVPRITFHALNELRKDYRQVVASKGFNNMVFMTLLKFFSWIAIWPLFSKLSNKSWK